MDGISAISFDVGWTLAYPHASIWEVFADLCTASGVPTTPDVCERLVRSLSQMGQAHAEEHFHAGATYTDSDREFAGMFEPLGQVIFAQMGVTDDHSGLVQRFLKRFWSADNWSAFPEVHEVLSQLRDRGMRVGVLSNAPTDLPQLLQGLGIMPLLDFNVVSAIEGVKKPDRRIFDITLSRAGVVPNKMLHVGDMYLEDILGGRAAGIHTLLMERGRHALFPNFRESEGRDLDAKAVVHSLTAVLDRLR